MNCEEVRKDFVLYLYGELEFEQEEAVDQHLDVCEACRTEMEKQRTVHSLMDGQEWHPPAELLQACRLELQSRVGRAPMAAPSPWQRIRDWFRFIVPSATTWRPLAAMLLLAVGFFGGRATDILRIGSEPALLRVRNLSQSPEGGVQLVLEEVRQRTMSGRVDDARIRQMLLSAATDPNDPGLRARTMDVLKDRCQQTEIRRALMAALEKDPNPGVRLKAIEALKPFAHELEMRRALSNVLLADDNPGVRTMAIDLLVENMQSEVIGTLQEVIMRESNPYIRQKGVKALREANASVETF